MSSPINTLFCRWDSSEARAHTFTLSMPQITLSLTVPANHPQGPFFFPSLINDSRSPSLLLERSKIQQIRISTVDAEGNSREIPVCSSITSTHTSACLILSPTSARVEPAELIQSQREVLLTILMPLAKRIMRQLLLPFFCRSEEDEKSFNSSLEKALRASIETLPKTTLISLIYRYTSEEQTAKQLLPQLIGAIGNKECEKIFYPFFVPPISEKLLQSLISTFSLSAVFPEEGSYEDLLRQLSVPLGMLFGKNHS